MRCREEWCASARGIVPATRFTTSLIEVVFEDELGGGQIRWARGASDEISASSSFGVRLERLYGLLVGIVNLKQTIHVCGS